MKPRPQYNHPQYNIVQYRRQSSNLSGEGFAGIHQSHFQAAGEVPLRIGSYRSYNDAAPAPLGVQCCTLEPIAEETAGGRKLGKLRLIS